MWISRVKHQIEIDKIKNTYDLATLHSTQLWENSVRAISDSSLAIIKQQKEYIDELKKQNAELTKMLSSQI